MSTQSIVIKARKPGEPGLISECRELWRYRYLIKVLVRRELKIRYKNSVLGIFWSLVTPLVQVLVMTIAFHYFLSSGPPNFSAYLLCAYLPWTFFQNSVLDSSGAVLSQLGLLKKVYFPREIPVVASVCANFVHFLLSLLVFILYRWVLAPIFIGWPGPPPIYVLWLPVLMILQFILTLGVSLVVCAWNVFYEDVKFVATMMMGFLYYLLPIFYFAENIAQSSRIHNPAVRWWVYHLYLANPLAWLVTAYKQIFFNPQIISNQGQTPVVMSAHFDWRYLLIATTTSTLVCLWGYAFFNARKWRFTERP
jgi:ABC-type polysaccharide/polyol phosphate export permease